MGIKIQFECIMEESIGFEDKVVASKTLELSDEKVGLTTSYGAIRSERLS